MQAEATGIVETAQGRWRGKQGRPRRARGCDMGAWLGEGVDKGHVGAGRAVLGLTATGQGPRSWHWHYSQDMAVRRASGAL